MVSVDQSRQGESVRAVNPGLTALGCWAALTDLGENSGSPSQVARSQRRGGSRRQHGVDREECGVDGGCHASTNTKRRPVGGRRRLTLTYNPPTFQNGVPSSGTLTGRPALALTLRLTFG